MCVDAVLRQNRRGAMVGHLSRMSQELIAVMIARAGGLNVPTEVGSVARHPHSDVHGAADEVTSGGASFVPVVQAADFPESDHVPLGDTLHASGRWRVFRQRQMCSRSVMHGEEIDRAQRGDVIREEGSPCL